ncbi:MAG: cell division protein FtsW [Clostridia bacterium]|nr:cell division protein FtsW [Clostridia bacterium]
MSNSSVIKRSRIADSKLAKRITGSKAWAKGNMDIIFLLVVLLLVAIGTVMMTSAGYSIALHKDIGSYNYLISQLKAIAIGIVAMLIISRINYNYYRRFVLIGVGLSVMLLVAALIYAMIQEAKNPDGKEEFGRWIPLPILGQFQPSEIAKIGLIAFYAWGCEKYHSHIVSKDKKTAVKTALIFGAVGVVFTLLVFKGHHLSGAILFVMLTLTMMYLGGFNKWWFVGILVFIGILVAIFVSEPDFLGILDEYQQERIIAWKDKSFEPGDARWQINNSLYAIGSGGLFGQGLGDSKMKHLYVSEAQSDFIFAIVCEELGFIGAAFILMLYAYLIYRGYKIAMRCNTKFGMLLVLGIMAHIGLQTVFNVFVVTDFFPNTGIGLPFFSAGGTSMLFLLCEMGMVLSVSRQSNMIKE